MSVALSGTREPLARPAAHHSNEPHRPLHRSNASRTTPGKTLRGHAADRPVALVMLMLMMVVVVMMMVMGRASQCGLGTEGEHEDSEGDLAQNFC